MNVSVVDPDVASFFRDPNASSVVSFRGQQIAAPSVQGAALSPDELMMGGGLRVLYLLVDRSPSMESVADLFLTDWNEEFIPGVKAAREDDISALRIGGLSFSSNITPIWQTRNAGGVLQSLHALDDLPALTLVEFNPRKGNGTASHRAIIDGTTNAVHFAAGVQRETGITPDVDVILLSDGANNESPRDTTEVRTVIEGGDKSRVRQMFFYFDTGDKPRGSKGLMDPKEYAILDLGYDSENVETFMAKPGETPDERRKRFRRMIRVISKVSASKGTSAVQASAAVSPDDIL